MVGFSFPGQSFTDYFLHLSLSIRSIPMKKQPEQLPPTAAPVHILSFCDGLCQLIAHQVFTPEQIFNWIVKGEIPKEFDSKVRTQKK
jgi:hypothetical protein